MVEVAEEQRINGWPHYIISLLVMMPNEDMLEGAWTYGGGDTSPVGGAAKDISDIGVPGSSQGSRGREWQDTAATFPEVQEALACLRRKGPI